MKEPFGYRKTLEIILAKTNGKCVLSITDIGTITGMTYKTIKHRFPLVNNKISAATLALCLTQEGVKK